MQKLSIKNTVVEKFLLNYGLYAAMMILIVVFAVLDPNFFKFSNIMNIFEQSAYFIVCAIGMTFVLISGEVDLSVGGVLAALTVFGTELINRTRNITLSILIMAGAALVVGLLNGFFVAKMGLPAFISTIAVGYIARGLAGYYTSGNTVYSSFTAFTNFAWNRVFGIPVLLIIAAFVLIVTVYILNFTTYGRTVFSYGASKKVTRFMGINYKATGISVYVISAFCVLIGALMVSSRSGVARFSTLPNLQMECIAASVIGGTSLTGGKGSLPGAAFGVLLLALIKSGLNGLGVYPFWQEVFIGVIIIFAALIDSYKTRSNA